MKSSLNFFAIVGALCVGLLTASAADRKSIGGPKGGRLLEKTEPRAEFFMEKDRTVTIAFYDAALKSVAATAQIVTVIADGKTKLEFEKKGDTLVSKSKLPDGEGYSVVVQFKQTAEARPRNFRFKLELYNCGGCNRAEYACTCDH